MMRWALDAEGRVVYLSRDWFEFTGVSEHHPPDVAHAQAAHPDDRAPAERMIAQAQATLSPFLTTLRLRRADQSYSWVIAGASPAFSLIDGECLGYFGCVEPLQSPMEPLGVLNLWDDAQHVHHYANATLRLDRIAQHIIASRQLAAGNGDLGIMKILDFALLSVGEKLSQALAFS